MENIPKCKIMMLIFILFDSKLNIFWVWPVDFRYVTLSTFHFLYNVNNSLIHHGAD